MQISPAVTNRFAQSDRRRTAALAVMTLAAAFWMWVLLALLTSASVQPLANNPFALDDQLELARLYHSDTQQALRNLQSEMATASEHFEAIAASQSTLAERSLAAGIGRGRMVANPARAIAMETLATLQTERLRLLERLTPEHPTVVELDARLESQQAQFDVTPELIRAPEAERSRENAQLAQEQSQLAAQYNEADHALRIARTAYDTALAIEQTAARQEAEIESQLTRLRASRPDSAVVTNSADTRGLPSRSWQLGCLLGLTVIGGGSTMAWAGGALHSVFSSSEQIARSLGIPVLAVIDAKSPRTALKQQLAHGALRLAVLFSAASLAFAAFLIISLLRSELCKFAELLRHPLDKLAVAIVIPGG